MGIRLIASDMDGTLLDRHSDVSEANIRAIQALDEYGVEFIICSGRDYGGAKALLESMGIKCGFICLSGAAVYDREGKRLLEIPMARQDVADAEAVLLSRGATMKFMTSGGWYSTSKREAVLDELCRHWNGGIADPGRLPPLLRERVEERMDSITFIRHSSEIPSQVSVYKICADDLAEETVMEIKDEFQAYAELAVASSFPTNIEVTGKNAQKGLALKYYAGRKQIPLEDVMVLGDSDNDLSMFTQDFGWTVAMSNSMPCILEAARYRTLSNEEDGVAWAIRTYVFGETDWGNESENGLGK